jgi:hypothetical protein
MAVVALIRRVRFYVSAQKKNYWFLEQRINIKFCVKLDNNARDTCAVLSETCGVEAMKSQVFLSGTNSLKGARMSKLEMKTMLITFFDIKGIVHSEFISHGRTVNQTYYVEILKLLLEAVLRKRPELRPNDWILHHGKASVHKVPSF